MTASIADSPQQRALLRLSDGSSRWVVSAIAAVLLLVVGALAVLVLISRELDQTRAAHADVQRTREIIQNLQRLLVRMQDAQLGEGRFVITGDEAFLEPYESAAQALEPQLAALDVHAQDPRARAILASLARAAREHVAYMDEVVVRRRAGDLEGAIELIRAQHGAPNADTLATLRGFVRRLEAREQELLTQRLAYFQHRSERSERIMVWALSAACVLVALAGAALLLHQRRKVLAEEEAQGALALLATTEAAHRDQALHMSAILDNVVDAIITINERGAIESWSKSAERLLGYEAGEVLGGNVRMLMADPHSARHDEYLGNYLLTGERRFMGKRREVEAVHKDGRRIPVDLGISEMRIGARRLFVGVVRDISERQAVERLKSGFVSTVSHELRTPLTSISGSLGLLAGGVAGELSPKALRLIEIAQQNSERLVRLINDILDLEKAESGKLEFRIERRRLKAIVQHAIDMNRGFAHGFGAAIELAADAEDVEVRVDRERLIQVLTNLLSNAVKFSPPGGVVRVSVTRVEDDACVSVEDEGPGVAPEFHSRIFERFAQADSSDSRAKGGTGLGLSIAKSIIERLGGAIDFERGPRKGARFYITLPIAKANAGAAAEPYARTG